jgi:hypothetical protein
LKTEPGFAVSTHPLPMSAADEIAALNNIPAAVLRDVSKSS